MASRTESRLLHTKIIFKVQNEAQGANQLHVSRYTVSSCKATNTIDRFVLLCLLARWLSPGTPRINSEPQVKIK